MMFKTLIHITAPIIFLLFSTNLSAGERAEALSPGTIRGVVYDATLGEPLEYATVALKTVTVSALVDGVITDANGFFRLTGVESGNYFLEITFIGYLTHIVEVTLEEGQRSLDAGQISLRSADETLDGVVVRGDRPSMSYQIDKRVINVSETHTSASGTAVDVLENIPSVTVDIEGDVSLRGSGSFTVLIDGKPSILDANDILNQIPASQIENIEIITNPSARYDPDGVAGIINIVMKQHRLQGVNGVANLDAGNHNRYGGDFLVNYRQDRFNFYLGGRYNQRGRPGESIVRTESYASDTTFLHSTGEFERKRNAWGFRGGVDFNINPSNTIGFGYRMGDRERGRESDRTYEEWSSQDPDRYIYSSYEESDRGGIFHRLTADYERKFDQNGHNLLFQATLSYRESEENSLNLLYDENNNIISSQRGIEAGPRSRGTFRLDYTLPFSETHKLETGLQSRITVSEETNDLFQYDSDSGQYELDDFFTKEVNYDTRIHSAYSTFSGERNNLGYQFGLRAEYTDRFIEMVGEPEDYTLNRWDYYPTVHFSYQLPADQQVMASYTRRLQRLRGWYLEPFYTWRDAYNIRIGNPELEPEYIDSYELNYMKRFERNVLSASVYYRVSHNKIEWIRGIYDEQPGVLLTTFENVGQDFSLGTELMMGFDPTSWWHFDLMGNIYDYRQEGELHGEDYSAGSFNWNARLNNDFRITNSTRLQLRGMYNSPTIRAQGEREAYFVTSFALRQDFMENDLSFTLQVRDLFGTMSRESVNWGSDFYNYRNWDPNTPRITLRISYRINNYRADRRQRPDNGMDDMNGDEEF